MPYWPVRRVETGSTESYRQVAERVAGEFGIQMVAVTLSERTAAGAPWRPVGRQVPAAVGRTGLAWGVGVHPPVERSASVMPSTS